MQQANQDKLIIFDTTLRDGEQSAGASMTTDEKVIIARQLEKLGVDVIEAGFPVSSPGDMEAVRRVAAEVRDSQVCGLARANDADVDVAIDAISAAVRPRLHTFIATSPIHMEQKLGMEPDDVLNCAVAAVRRARAKVEDVEFSMEDAGRSELDFLCRITEATIDAGASTINIPDTVGYTIPEEFAALVRALIEKVPNSDKAVFSVHCHNDLGLAVANSLAGLHAGARQIECTINGIGERAGNTALEEVVMAVRTRSEKFPCRTTINCDQIVPASRLVAQISGIAVQPNKAIVGVNAFAHESGIHQDGMLKRRETYEIMRPEDVGWESNRICLGKLSGRRAFKDHMQNLGYDLDKQALDAAFVRFKQLADRQRNVQDAQLIELVRDEAA